MIQEVGKVIEVFIPKEYKNGQLLDVMDRTQIGFKVKTNSQTYEIVQKQNEINANIMKNDLVIITKQTISNKDFIEIDLYEGDKDG